MKNVAMHLFSAIESSNLFTLDAQICRSYIKHAGQWEQPSAIEQMN